MANRYRHRNSDRAVFPAVMISVFEDSQAPDSAVEGWY
jgi:hypothetical protein